MDVETFGKHLILASERARTFATKFVHNELPPVYQYLIDVSYGAEPSTRRDGIPYPAISYTRGIVETRCLGPMQAGDAVGYLWRDGTLPRWINIGVHSTDGEYTYLKLDFSREFLADDNRLMYGPTAPSPLASDIPPFAVVGPTLPVNWRDQEEGWRFDLHW